MTEYSIIKLFLTKEHYNKYASIIYKISTEKEIEKILLVINKYYEEYKHHVYISIDELEVFFFYTYPSEQNNDIYKDIFNRLRGLEISDSLATTLVHTYLEKAALSQIQAAITPGLLGESNNTVLQIPQIIEEYKSQALLVDEEDSPFYEATVEELVQLTGSKHGLRWGLKCLDTNLGTLPKHTLTHVFARVGTGKSSFISSTIANLIPQLTGDEKILWVGNEEHVSQFNARAYHSLLRITKVQFEALEAAGRGPEVKRRFLSAGGDKLLFAKSMSATYEDILALMEKNNIRVLISDIADHVSFRGDRDLTGPTRLGELYRRFRQLASGYDCDVITAGQASAECAGKKIVHQEHMHNSKTDKPGALDNAIGIGATYQEEDKNTRWINICKNKFGVTISPITSVTIDTERGLFFD